MILNKEKIKKIDKKNNNNYNKLDILLGYIKHLKFISLDKI
jgi:hypothetical protein